MPGKNPATDRMAMEDLAFRTAVLVHHPKAQWIAVGEEKPVQAWNPDWVRPTHFVPPELRGAPANREFFSDEEKRVAEVITCDANGKMLERREKCASGPTTEIVNHQGEVVRRITKGQQALQIRIGPNGIPPPPPDPLVPRPFDAFEKCPKCDVWNWHWLDGELHVGFPKWSQVVRVCREEGCGWKWPEA